MKLWVLAALATIGTCGAAFALQPPALEIAFSAGRVSVSAIDLPVADVLVAWARTGHTDLTGTEYLGARRVERRPANVDPESFYHYSTAAADPPDALKPLLTPPEISREPLHRTLDVTPEVLYTYSPTPQPAEPSVTSSILPPTPALDPEVRYTYDPIASDMPPYMLSRTNPIPNIPMFEGWTGLRLPGRVIRYVREN
jgi:hypothetical protein